MEGLYACFEHAEIAIDDYVNEKEEAPQIVKVQNQRCSYCKEDAKYEIK